MKKFNLLILSFLFLVSNSYSQINCESIITASSCNHIQNPEFNFNASALEAFRQNNVPSWGDINRGTSDINGALGPINGWSIPSLPSYFKKINFASMLLDNLNYSTEGIASKTAQIKKGGNYAFSFFLSSSFLNSYRHSGGRLKFKIFLTHCQDFRSQSENVGNPEISGEKQLIFCQEFSELGNTDWQQFFVSFTSENDFDMIVVYPELINDRFDGGSYIHFAYPELVEVNPIAIYHERDRKTVLSSCGVTNGSYSWEGPNGIIGNEATITDSTTSGQSYPTDYIFNMWVPNSVGNVIQDCSPASSPIINIHLTSTAQLSVDCSTQVPPNSCNLIPNNNFNLLSQSITDNAFNQGNVPYWSSISSATPDINSVQTSFTPPPGFPIAGVNFASLIARNDIPNWTEGIYAKINPLTANNDYAFSFFFASSLAGSFPNGRFTFKIVLTNCQNINQTNNPNTSTPPSLGSYQEIYCATHTNTGNSGWEQMFVKFTAQGNFDMIVVYPEILDDIPGYAGVSYLHFGFPELIQLGNIQQNTPAGICSNTILSTCGVQNASYVWRDPNNNIFGGNSNTATLTNNTSGNYSVSWYVPGANSTVNNCSINNPVISETINITNPSAGTPMISPSGPVDYYYFWEQGRTAGNVILTSSNPNNNQWYENGIIPDPYSNSGSSGQIFKPYEFNNLVAGTKVYTVKNTLTGCISAPVTVNYISYNQYYPWQTPNGYFSPTFGVNTPTFYCKGTTGIIRQFDLGPSANYTWSFLTSPVSSGNINLVSQNQNIGVVSIGSSSGYTDWIVGTATLNNAHQKILDYSVYYEASDPPNGPSFQYCASNNQLNLTIGTSGFDSESWNFGSGTIISPPLFTNSITLSGHSPQTVIVNYTTNSVITRTYTNINPPDCFTVLPHSVTANVFCKTYNISESGNQILLLPNPASSDVTILSKSGDLFSLEICNLTNNIFYKSIIKSGTSFKLNLSGFKSGIYNCRILTKNGTTINKKLIITK